MENASARTVAIAAAIRIRRVGGRDGLMAELATIDSKSCLARGGIGSSRWLLSGFESRRSRSMSSNCWHLPRATLQRSVELAAERGAGTTQTHEQCEFAASKDCSHLRAGEVFPICHEQELSILRAQSHQRGSHLDSTMRELV